MFGNYLQSVHYVDAALGGMVEDLKNRGLWENTIFMFYGDHDSSIKDQPLYEKFLGRSLNDLDMAQIMNEVPLLVHLPDGAEAGVFEKPSGLTGYYTVGLCICWGYRMTPTIIWETTCMVGWSAWSYCVTDHSLMEGCSIFRRMITFTRTELVMTCLLTKNGNKRLQSRLRNGLEAPACFRYADYL